MSASTGPTGTLQNPDAFPCSIRTREGHRPRFIDPSIQVRAPTGLLTVNTEAGNLDYPASLGHGVAEDMHERL
jgi:hypothetical protein